MAGHEMAAEFFAEAERAFEIDVASFLPFAERGPGQGRVGDINAELCALLGLGDIDDGETTTVARNRRAFLEVRALIWRGDGEAAALPPAQRAYAADNAGEHLAIRQAVIRSGPNARDRVCAK